MVAFCAECFGHPGLRRRLASLVATTICEYHDGQPAHEVDVIAEIIDPVFRAYHYRHAEWNKGEELTWSLSEFLDADESVVNALAEVLVENDDNDEPFYEETNFYESHRDVSGLSHRFQWLSFRQDILHRRRFFGPNSKQILDNLFLDVHLLRDKTGASPVYPLQQGTTIYRGRVADTDDQAKYFLRDPRREIGPPPIKLGRAGRMNPTGIRAFYGALDMETCVPELRPGRGRTVVIASFTLVRPIYVMDLSFFGREAEQGDIFESDHLSRAQQWSFMSHFMDEISQPVMPEDELLDYIPTQAVAEYLSNYSFKIDGMKKQVEALIYPSAQNFRGRNVVFLGEAAEVDNPRASSFIAPLFGSGPSLVYVENSAKPYGVQIDYSAYELRHLTRTDDIPF